MEAKYVTVRADRRNRQSHGQPPRPAERDQPPGLCRARRGVHARRGRRRRQGDHRRRRRRAFRRGPRPRLGGDAGGARRVSARQRRRWAASRTWTPACTGACTTAGATSASRRSRWCRATASWARGCWRRAAILRSPRRMRSSPTARCAGAACITNIRRTSSTSASRRPRSFSGPATSSMPRPRMRLGMVNHVVPRAELETATRWLAERIALNDLLSLKLSKMSVNQAADIMGQIGCGARLGQFLAAQPLLAPGDGRRQQPRRLVEDGRTSASARRSGHAAAVEGSDAMQSRVVRWPFFERASGWRPHADEIRHAMR